MGIGIRYLKVTTYGVHETRSDPLRRKNRFRIKSMNILGDHLWGFLQGTIDGRIDLMAEGDHSWGSQARSNFP